MNSTSFDMGCYTKRQICFLLSNYGSSKVIQKGVKDYELLVLLQTKMMYMLYDIFGPSLSLSFLDTHYWSSLLYFATINDSTLVNNCLYVEKSMKLAIKYFKCDNLMESNFSNRTSSNECFL